MKAAPNEATDGLDETDSSSLPQFFDQSLITGVVAVNAQQKITAVSPEAEACLGLDSTKAIGRSLSLLPEQLCAILMQGLKSGTPVTFAQIELNHSRNERQTIQVSSTLIHGSKGQVDGVIAIVSNITPARHLDQNLRRMDRLASIGTLSASMAHEVKNALVAVKTFVDLLIKQNQDAALAEIVGRELQRINSIVSQMLHFGGPARPTLEVIHLHQVLDQSLDLIQHHLEGRRIQLIRNFDASPDTVRADVYQLEQAFINLFFNALDAMGANGELRVSTEFVPVSEMENSRTPILRVTVQDNGMGISSENLSRLFEPFFTTKSNGTGLGLPITRRIVQEHRGELTVASELHQGTTFTVSLPSAAQQP